MKTPVIAETTNLRIRQFVVSDGKFVRKLVNSPGWIEFIGNRAIQTEIDAQLYILTGLITSYIRHGFGMYLVELKKPRKKSIGMCGLIKRDGLEHVDIGFAFLPEFNGKGYAYEAARATLEHAAKDLGLKEIVSITNDNNIRSIRLLEKLGLVYEKKVKLPNEEKELLLFTGKVAS